MKVLEFETSKGRFLVVDSTTLDKVSGQALVDEYGDYIILSETTEEQASEIVDETVMWKKHKVKCYRYRSYISGFVAFDNSIESLHSLLESKGIHLFKNPLQSSKPTADLAFYDNVKDVKLIYNKWQEAEQKTFYNPYIFKL